MRVFSRWILVVAMSLSLVTGAQAGEIEGVTFADEVRIAASDGENPRDLQLYSMALLRYRVIFRGYVAAVYLPEGASGSQVLDDIPRRLELSYFWGIGGDDFGRAADDKFEESLSSAERETLRERIAQLHEAYIDVEPGDRYALDYLPGEGTTLRYNGKPLITIPGADFARAYFGLWLGPDPLDESLRDALLLRE